MRERRQRMLDKYWKLWMIEKSEFSTLKPLLQPSSDLPQACLCYTRKQGGESIQKACKILSKLQRKLPQNQ
jgi:hypothetical protein